MDVFAHINLAKQINASDIHLNISSPPKVRVDGALRQMDSMPPLETEDIEQAFEQLTSEQERKQFRDCLELDLGYTVPEVCRLRCNVAKQRGTMSIAIRLLPNMIPTIDELELPGVCKELIARPRGLIMVSGPTGSGKSTTLAAMINYLNHIDSRRVVTIEDPIEYVHPDVECSITQRELGSDTLSFVEALRHVLRQDPDVILLGEMRDVETAAAVLNIAETGHLVLTTGHAPSASQTIERVIDLFPLHERHLAQVRLASLLIGVLCQTLVPRDNGPGRIAAVEIMLANGAVKNLIREGKIHQLPNTIRTNIQSGMQLLDQALLKLYSRGVISRNHLFAFCNDVDDVKKEVTDVVTSSL